MPSTAKAGRKPSTVSRIRGRGNEAVRDAVEQAAELAKDGRHLRAIQTPEAPVQMSAKEAKQYASNLSPEFLECRLIGHDRKLTNVKIDRRSGVRSWTRYCPRCKYSVDQEFNRHGELISNKPDYPEGYLNTGRGRVTSSHKNVFRVVEFDRLVAEAADAVAKSS